MSPKLRLGIGLAILSVLLMGGAAVGIFPYTIGGITNGQVLAWNSATNRFEPSSGGGGGGGTPAGSPGDLQTNAGAGNFGAITPATGGATFLATPSQSNLEAFLSSGGVIHASQTITQNSHGFSAGQAVYLKSDGTYGLAKADNVTEATRYSVGVIQSVTTNTFLLVRAGSITLSGLTAGKEYFLSDATAGLLTATAPTTSGSWLVPVMFSGTTTLASVGVGAPVQVTLIDLSTQVTGLLGLTHGGAGIDLSGATGIVHFNNGGTATILGDAAAFDTFTVHGANIASASTVNLETATGHVVDVTGTTSITAITLADGHHRWVRFTGILTLTNGANLVLPSGANITTAAGDYAEFVGYASSVVRCVSYTKADGTAVVGGGGGSVAWGAITGTLSAQTDLNTALGLKAPLASPTLTGTPAAPTAAVDTSTTQLATTGFVIGQLSASGDGTPAMDGTAARGTSTHGARADHVHPTDTSRAALASPTLTGTPAAPTAAAGTSTTQIATTAFVTTAILLTETTLTDGATVTQTLVAGTGASQNAKVTLGGNRTFAFSGLFAGANGNLRVIQDATGSRTLALPANSRVNGSTTTVTLLTAAAAENILSWYSPDGTNLRWTVGTY